MAIEIKKIDELNNILQKEENVIIDFYANWCGPCQMYTPVFNEVALKRKDVKMVSINIDINTEIVKFYSVQSIPATFLFKKGKQVNKILGFMSVEKLNHNIDDLVKS
ncbi:MAG: thioredoxin [Candidatus Hepatoplasma vulgare]|nr:MAG: thioredoxin [Candidatus Hepatoplasma sp.]